MLMFIPMLMQLYADVVVNAVAVVYVDVEASIVEVI